MGRFDEERISEMGDRGAKAFGWRDDRMRRCADVGGKGDVLHQRLGQVEQERRRARERQPETFQRVDDVDARYFPFRVALAEVDEDVVPLRGQPLQLAVGRELVQRDVIHRVPRQQVRQIAARVVVFVVDVRRRVVRLEHADFHDLAMAVSMISRTVVANDPFPKRMIAPIEV